MWIALAVLGFLAALITVIVLLPVKVIIKNDEKNELILRYKFLGKLYGEDPNPDDPIIKALKTATGVDRLEKKVLKQNVQTSGLQKTVTESYSMLVDLLKEVVALLKLCVVTKLQVKIRCAGDGADQVAIHYGECCAATHTLLNLLQSFLKIRKRTCDIDISCDFLGGEGSFDYHVILRTRVGRVVAALWRVAMAEAKRMKTQQESQRK